MPNPAFTIDAARWAAAPSIDAYIDGAHKNQEFWRNARRLARVDDAMVARLSAAPGPWRLLALSEDWCSDAMSTLPAIARLVERAGNAELRVLARDEHPDLMDAHLTGSTRSIPVVMVLDNALVERGWWGPRPAPLHAWLRSEGLGLEPKERSRRKREWYARDRGATTVSELVALVERVGAGQ